MKTLKFFILIDIYSVHRLDPTASIPKAVFASPFYSISRAENELSIVAPQTVEINAQKTETGWRVLKVEGPLDFALTGVLAQIATTLAAAGVSIFAISTFDTDYLLVKDEALKTAKAALIAADHKFGRTPIQEPVKEEGFFRQSYDSLLENQIPTIKKLFTEKINPSALKTLRSETAVAAVMGGLYEFLPAPIRLVVNRDLFIRFCINNLDKILPDLHQPEAAPDKPARTGTKTVIKKPAKAAAKKIQ